MEIYDGRYFHLNKKYLTMMGLWPYYDWKRYIVRSIYLLMVFGLGIPHVLGVIVDRKDTDKLLDHTIAVMFSIGLFLKLFSICVCESKMKIMFDTIAENWRLIVGLGEREVLIESAERARKLVIAYTAYIFGNGMFFILLPLLPLLLDIIAPLPTPRETLRILNGEFLINDIEAHYWLFYLSDAVSVLLVLVIVVTIDTAYIACMEHCVGLFAIIKYRLQKPGQLVHIDLSGKDKTYEAMVTTIQLHQRVLQFANVLGDSYSMCFLTLMLLHIIQLPVASVMILINLGQPVHLIRYLFCFIALIMHQLTIHWVAQRLTDASDNIFIDAYCNEWYLSSPRTKKLLSLLMLRCAQPSKISAGGIIDMGMATFYGLTSKALSYITVLASFR